MARPIDHDRRLHPRISVRERPDMAAARIRPGRQVTILNVSRSGALIETDGRLLPGASVDLQLGDPIALCRVKARVLRCHVVLLNKERVCYRGAMVFEERLAFEVGTTDPVGRPCPSEADV